jgi:hypothetical protein
MDIRCSASADQCQLSTDNIVKIEKLLEMDNVLPELNEEGIHRHSLQNIIQISSQNIRRHVNTCFRLLLTDCTSESAKKKMLQRDAKQHLHTEHVIQENSIRSMCRCSS